MNPDNNIHGKELLDKMQNTFSLQVQPHQDLQKAIAAAINRLINQDFNLLVTILYTLDVSEEKLKLALLDAPGEDAGYLIAGLVLERETEKQRTRARFNRHGDIAEEDKW